MHVRLCRRATALVYIAHACMCACVSVQMPLYACCMCACLFVVGARCELASKASSQTLDRGRVVPAQGLHWPLLGANAFQIPNFVLESVSSRYRARPRAFNALTTNLNVLFSGPNPLAYFKILAPNTDKNLVS